MTRRSLSALRLTVGLLALAACAPDSLTTASPGGGGRATAEATAGVRINEVESNGGVPGDWVELHNAGAAPVDLSGYVFRDNDDARGYVLPAGTTIPAGGFLVLDEAQFDFGLGANDTARLFAAWTQAYDWVRNPSLAFNAPIGDAARFLARTAKTWSGPRWALTLHAVASRIAPIATWDRIHIYVDVPDASGLEYAGEEQGWEPAEQGNVVLMKPYYKSSVWHGMEVSGGIPVVSPLQLALDLWHYPLRGREQAEHLLGAMAGIHL